MEARAVQPAGNLSRIAHLRVQETSIRETVNENTNRWPRAYRSGHGKSGINLSLQLNAPILCEGRAVATPADDRSPVTFEIPPGAFSPDSTAPAELALLPHCRVGAAQQSPSPGQTTVRYVRRNQSPT